jgi:hypothetical protein
MTPDFGTSRKGYNYTSMQQHFLFIAQSRDNEHSYSPHQAEFSRSGYMCGVISCSTTSVRAIEKWNKGNN